MARHKIPADPTKDLAQYVLERTNNGQDLVDRLLELGLTTATRTAADRRIAIAAIEALLDRGLGKPQLRIEHGGTDADAEAEAGAYRQLTDAELELLARFPDAARSPRQLRAVRQLAALDGGGQVSGAEPAGAPAAADDPDDDLDADLDD